MRAYLVIRYFIPIALMLGWVIYQLVIKRKKWDSIQADALTCLVFAGVWVLIAYMMTN
jgi:hypothetical protein